MVAHICRSSTCLAVSCLGLTVLGLIQLLCLATCVCGHIPLLQAAKIDHTGLIRPLAVQVIWSMLAEGIKQ